MKGISTNRNLSSKAACLKGLGIDFVFRYYSATTQMPEKRITLAEAEALSAAGILLAIVYQDRANQIGDFSATSGAEDAAAALQAAKNLKQPQGSAIYFAADFDPSASQVRGAITSYFTAVQKVFADAGKPFDIGVYGSGLTCRLLKEAGLTRYTWLSESRGFRESRTYTDWDVEQIIPTTVKCGFSTHDYEDCNSKDNTFGAFSLPHVSVSGAGVVTVASVNSSQGAIDAFLDEAKADVGVEEKPRGSNRGPRVEAMLAITGLGGGHPWCAAAVAAWGVESIGKAWPLPKSASCDVLLDFARRHTVLHSSPKRGDIFLLLASAFDAIHTGVVSDVSGDTISTIEGNTDPAGSREGFKVAARSRKVKPALKYIRWVDLVEDFNDSTGWTLLVGSNVRPVEVMLIDGTAYAPLRDILLRVFSAPHVKQSLGWGDIGATWDDMPLPFSNCNRLMNGQTWCPVRKAAAWLALEVQVSGKQIKLFRP